METTLDYFMLVVLCVFTFMVLFLLGYVIVDILLTYRNVEWLRSLVRWLDQHIFKRLVLLTNEEWAYRAKEDYLRGRLCNEWECRLCKGFTRNPTSLYFHFKPWYYLEHHAPQKIAICERHAKKLGVFWMRDSAYVKKLAKL